MPDVPEMPRLLNVTTPLTAVAVVVPTSVAPEETDAVTTELESEVAALPFASVMEMTG